MRKGLNLSRSALLKIHEMNVSKGLRVVRLAKRFCAVDTGRLRSSITIVDSEGVISLPQVSKDVLITPSVPYSVRVGTGVVYAGFVEFGTVFQSAQPFLRPAFDEVFR